MAGTFKATVGGSIGGKFAPLINLRDDGIDISSMITTYNTAVTDIDSETLGKRNVAKIPG